MIITLTGMTSKIRFLLLAILIFVNISPILPLFSSNFRSFLRNTYGKAQEQLLTRNDLGDGGSFGGGDSPTIIHRPIILMHGLTGTALQMKVLKDFYQSKNYSDSELYATSYGPKGEPTDLGESGASKCEYVKAVRLLIEAVLAYTNSTKINVIGYSMGVLITRKAILGGRCVDDTDTFLGESLTDSVENYIGIAGPNYGALFCNNSISLKTLGSCNVLNGMSCNSTYLDDINAKEHYEGEFVYVIQTVPDEVVGNRLCDANFTTRIEGADDTITTIGQLHSGVYFESAAQQLKLLNRNP